MKQTTENNYVPESAKPKNKPTQQSTIDYSAIQKMITEAVNNALKENGLLVESVEKSNDVFSFKVGKHIFEGKVTKIKKVS
jgi:isocitrate/isopropylmalate dehydrogenase